MSEEAKEPKEEKEKKPQAVEAKEVKESAPAEEEEAPKPKALKHERVKVTKMTLDQVEKALAEVEQKMGGFHSHHAQALLGRKEVLKREEQIGKQKAA